MKIYQVGGAVRDKLLGKPVKDRDWVVVGATPEEMDALGYQPVGKDFPVFLHPETYEEYALARTERKTGPGYKGFAVHYAPDVTLEDDLARRDLTINAMAEDSDGRLIDPFGGRTDLENKILRHVSPAFIEDPLRVLRVARFATRLDFQIADETLALMRQIVESGELDHLVAERVWSELERALGEARPVRFFEVLRDCGALETLFPDIERLFGVPQPPEHHPEVDTGVHTMLVLEQAARLSDDRQIRFAVLTHDLGKGTTPPAEWPKHTGHEERSAELIRLLCKRYRIPNAVAERVWSELERALGEARPVRFFEVLRDCGALETLFPDIERLFGVPQPPEHHPEVDTGVHTMLVLEQAARLSDDRQIRFAVLTHDLGKGTTPPAEWPKHTGHEERSAELIRLLCKRYRIPNAYRDLAILVARYHGRCHRAAELRPATMLKALKALDAFRNPQRFAQFLLACEADARGRKGLEERDYPQAEIFRKAYIAAAEVNIDALVSAGLTGEKMASEIERLQIEAIKQASSPKP